MNAFLIVFGVVSVAVPAMAQDSLESARRAFAEGALDVALERFTEALEHPPHTREELAQIHRYLGVLRVAQGDVEGAMREFEYSLALVPDQTAPAELGASHRARFDAIRAQRTGPIGLELDSAGAVSREAPTRVRAGLMHAPEGLVHSTRIAIDGTGWQTEIAPNATEFQLPPEAWGGLDRVTLSASAVDSHGNVVVAGSVELAPEIVLETQPLATHPRLAPQEPLEDDPDAGGTIFESPIFWTIVGALVVAAGVTAVLLATATTEYELTPRFETVE